MTINADENKQGSAELTALLASISVRLDQAIQMLAKAKADTDKRLDLMQTYVDKALHVASKHSELYAQRSARPFYPLDDPWALTSLDSGHPFFINTRDRNISPWIIMGGHWERNVERVLLDYVRPNMHVLDIGAHFGYYTVKLGMRLTQGGCLHAFEPNPEVNAVCEENIKINGMASFTTLHKCALGDSNTTATLTRSTSNMASANLIGEQSADFSVEVQVRRLDDELSDLRPVDLIKLDAEGYEKRILDGGVETLRRSPHCAIMLELSLDRWERAAPLSDLLPSCGAGKELFAVLDDGRLEHFELEDIKPFLMTRAFHESYFLIAPRACVLANIRHLLIK